ncbi:hypothetical protein FA13DRAFT_500727 [Coprinellus micaceus]|uniref:Uncharacterized protein n=1 Tax=Coprinellus micaceus TaxID=71717 RepID=A0A4Y7TA64_COPMI|nr:hypothetical protein FA13DRAFT_500727 [Coprinellus micaceus]
MHDSMQHDARKTVGDGRVSPVTNICHRRVFFLVWVGLRVQRYVLVCGAFCEAASQSFSVANCCVRRSLVTGRLIRRTLIHRPWHPLTMPPPERAGKISVGASGDGRHGTIVAGRTNSLRFDCGQHLHRRKHLGRRTSQFRECNTRIKSSPAQACIQLKLCSQRDLRITWQCSVMATPTHIPN